MRFLPDFGHHKEVLLKVDVLNDLITILFRDGNITIISIKKQLIMWVLSQKTKAVNTTFTAFATEGGEIFF
jgi:hypothetical protein